MRKTYFHEQKQTQLKGKGEINEQLHDFNHSYNQTHHIAPNLAT